jgi:hypothetical protein
MNGLLKTSKMFIKRNASTILTVVGGAGVITTTVLAVKATPKALTLLEEAKKEKGEELTVLEKVLVTTPTYIPTVVSGMTTLACIFGANMLNKRQQAALMSAYALLDNSFKEYKVKVNELYGEDANDQIKEEIAKDKYKKTEIKNDEVLFYDEFSNQFFTSTLVKVKEAEYILNRDIHTLGWAELKLFYNYLGIENVEGSEALGWSEGGNYEAYWQAWVDFNHRKAVLDDGTEYTIITMFQEPYVDYENY